MLLSSSTSFLTLYLVGGKTFGVMEYRVRPRAFVILTFVMETNIIRQRLSGTRAMTPTAIVISDKNRQAFVRSTSYCSHDGGVGSGQVGEMIMSRDGTVRRCGMIRQQANLPATSCALKISMARTFATRSEMMLLSLFIM